MTTECQHEWVLLDYDADDKPVYQCTVCKEEC